jgi:hypothetical protein
VNVGPLKSKTFYPFQILQQRIFQYVIKWEAVALNLEVNRQDIKSTKMEVKNAWNFIASFLIGLLV